MRNTTACTVALLLLALASPLPAAGQDGPLFRPKHPIGQLLHTVEHLLADVTLPMQYAPRRRDYG